ncbi:MAG: DNA-3-methyladenine glycosylase 2 family protein [Blastocatellia bacterium]|nr:DNA-3-methyladenine glycosylase 2 family protein [Blastocatellia bacterium]
MPKVNDKLDLFKESLRAAERHLSRRDPVMRISIKKHNPCLLQPHTRYFETLVKAIVSQQLSTKVADTILTRFQALYSPARFPKPGDVLLTPAEKLRATGISNSKVSFIKDLAARAEDGTLKLTKLSRMSDEEAIEMLIQVKGIGVWTAHMFLIFSLGRLDVLPVGDLGIRKAIQTAYQFDELPNPDQIEQVAAERGWRPYCSVASWYLWRIAGEGESKRQKAKGKGQK